MSISSGCMRTPFVLAISGLFFGAAAWAGLGFGDPATLNTGASTDTMDDVTPVVVTDYFGTWVCVWDSLGTDHDLYTSRSTDNGATWTTSHTLNTNAASDMGNDIYPDLATDGAGHWVAVWNTENIPGGTIGNDQDILVSRSQNNGDHWTAPAVLNTNAATDSGNDYRPRIATDGAGHWVAVWQSTETLGNTVGTDYDIFVAQSADAGATWTAPVSLNSFANTDSADDEVPTVVTDSAGVWVCVWQSSVPIGGTSDGDIWISRSTNNGATWSAATPLNSNAATDAGDDSFPTLAADGGGNWVAAWHSTDNLGGTVGPDPDIFVSRSTNDAVAWSSVKALNTNAGTDLKSDYYPAVTSDGSGNWLATWTTDDTPDGAIHGEYDVYISRSTDLGATWTPREQLDLAAGDDSNSGVIPRLANDGAEHCVVVWFGQLRSGGGFATDNDIHVAYSSEAFGNNLTLLTPNGGEKWKIGKRKKIEWTSFGDSGANVKLELLRNGSVATTIKNSTANDGAQKWTLPQGLTAGKGYKVRITSTTDAGISDFSDESFRIRPAK